MRSDRNVPVALGAGACTAEPISKEPGFRSTLTSLWYRLMSLGIIALVFPLTLLLTKKVQGWSFFLTPPEVAFEVAVRVIAAALAGVALGSLYTAAVAPFLWRFSSSRQRVAEWATKVAVVLVVFLNSRYALEVLLKWSNRGVRYHSFLLVSYLVAFAVALCVPRARKEVMTSLDGFLGEKMTRLTAIATVLGTAALVATEFVLVGAVTTVKAAPVPSRPKSNFLLITFDALNAEDMSLYGGKLPTTPNIDAYASKATVFTNFYSASTFTTPSVGAMLTGRYPSEIHVYHLEGQARGEDVAKSLPQLMRTAGYSTGAFVSNPLAYYLAKSLDKAFDVLPEPVFDKTTQHLWNATRPLHQDTGIGSRLDEYFDLEQLCSWLGGLPQNLYIRYRPGASFEQARQVLAKLPDGYFLWVHVVTPHDPYLPDPADRGRFIPDAERRTFEEDIGRKWQPHYEPDQQSQVDRRRLAYDEFIATADRAFGTFMSELEKSGKLRDTTVIVSADHGESFEGGVYKHESAYQTRPVIHVPLIIRTPGQQDGRKIAFTADQTALAPTILELAGQPKPNWMRGQSLVGWLNRDGQGEGEGLAFTEYMERNSLFKPLRNGTVGVIDGRHQYVLYLDTQKGELRPLNQAHIWNLDRTADNPARAEALRAAIHSRFPGLAQEP
jgi:arylsulfatase A-like enzyme